MPKESGKSKSPDAAPASTPKWVATFLRKGFPHDLPPNHHSRSAPSPTCPSAQHAHTLWELVRGAQSRPITQYLWLAVHWPKSSACLRKCKIRFLIRLFFQLTLPIFFQLTLPTFFLPYLPAPCYACCALPSFPPRVLCPRFTLCRFIYVFP
jgi:hypothetical protein